MKCTQVGRVDGKVCGRDLIGTRHWCWVHPEAEQDFGPYAGESQRDRQTSAAVNQSRERPWEDDEAENLVLPGFELAYALPGQGEHRG